MRDATRNGHYVLCPLCEGKGKMHRSEMIAKLATHEVEARLTACRHELVRADGDKQDAVSQTAFHEQVLKGPVTRMLWRRSHKE